MQRVLAARLVLAGALADKLELIEVAHWLRQSLMAVVLAEAVDKHFPSGVRIIAEPGRFYTSSAFTLACNVIARRTVPNPGLGGSTCYMLYVNDGLYGN